METEHDGVMTTGYWTQRKLVTLAKGLVAPHTLLYVARAGSYLFGTDTEESDIDFKGLYLPSAESLLLGEKSKTLKYSTGNDESGNSKGDLDLELLPVHSWLKDLERGDSNALAMLFASLNSNMVLFADELVVDLFMNYHSLYDPTNTDGFVGFAQGQAVKYGVKGHRLKLVENVLGWVISHLGEHDPEQTRLRDFFLDELVEECTFEEVEERGYLELVEKDGNRFLKVLTKEHQDTTRVSEFVERMEKERDNYGNRAHTAKEMGGKDWKALSHSLRTLVEAREMKTRGYVSYPLDASGLLLRVKQGEFSMEEYTGLYREMEEELKKLDNFATNHYDKVKSNNALLQLYGKEPLNDQRS